MKVTNKASQKHFLQEFDTYKNEALFISKTSKDNEKKFNRDDGNQEVNLSLSKFDTPYKNTKNSASNSFPTKIHIRQARSKQKRKLHLRNSLTLQKNERNLHLSNKLPASTWTSETTLPSMLQASKGVQSEWGGPGTFTRPSPSLSPHPTVPTLRPFPHTSPHTPLPLGLIVSPPDRPLVRGVGDTLTLTCTLLPANTLGGCRFYTSDQEFICL